MATLLLRSERAAAFGSLLIFTCFSASALAHPGGGPAVAWPNEPYETGVRANQEYMFSWIDSNFLNTSTTGTITIDWYYTARMPPTFQLGVTPRDLEGTPIVLGIPEEDRTDAFVWDTSAVPAGSYWIWSRVNDLPDSMGSLQIIAFSRGTVTIAHPGDAVHPAIILPQPNSPFLIADESFRLIYKSFDPDGTGRVKLEAMQNRDGSDAFVIDQDLPAIATGTVTWDTSQLATGDWILRATIADARGLSFTAYSRFLLRVEHLGNPVADAGVNADAAPVAQADGGTPEPVDEGCSCSASERSTGSAALMISALLFQSILRAKRRPREARAASKASR